MNDVNNEHYEYMYTKYIEKLYGNRRQELHDEILINSNLLPHIYNIDDDDRIDLTGIETYTIDPVGCEDADDAFSIYYEEQNLFLAIHIADPTEYINIKSELWYDIEKRIITKYPSNRPPIHMMPQEIMEKSSLMVNKFGSIKNAITILTEIDTTTFLPIGTIQLLFTKVKLKKENSLNYLDASNIIDSSIYLQNGLKISEAFQIRRSAKTIGTKLNDVSTALVAYNNHKPYLYLNSINEIKMKQMIAEFAIFSNSFVGEYLKINFNGAGIFRTCNARDFINDDNYKNLSGDDLLHEIITNGIHAEYLNKVASHDLVGSSEYTHFTSPIRRVSDCICHYLLKYIYLQKNKNVNTNIPFSIENLEKLSEQCVIQTKKIKKIQFKDTKFRLIQILHLMLDKSPTIPIKLSYYITSYKSPFLNLIIKRINDFNVYMSYTLMINNYEYVHNPNIMYTIDITNVHCLGKFDTGSIPELDSIFI
jgi:exoribonuclease R